MASVARATTDEARRTAVSPRPKGRESAKDTLCRNVTIYGHCRYENKGESVQAWEVQGRADGSIEAAPLTMIRSKCTRQQQIGATRWKGGWETILIRECDLSSVKKRFNVESPSFTPASHNGPSLAVNGAATKATGLSPKAASAAPFKPKGFNPGSNENGGYLKKQYNPAASDWSLAPSADVPEFLPQAHSITPNIMGKHTKRSNKNRARNEDWRKPAFIWPSDTTAAETERSSHSEDLERGSVPIQENVREQDEIEAHQTLRRAVSFETGLNSRTPPSRRRDQAGDFNVLAPAFEPSHHFSADAAPFKPGRNTPSPRPMYSTSSWSSDSSASRRAMHARPAVYSLSRHPFIYSPRHPPSWSSPSKSTPSRHQHDHLPPSNFREAQYLSQDNSNNMLQQGLYDPYVNSTPSLTNQSHGHHQAQMNPYSQDPAATAGGSYYQNNSFTQPLQYHLYTSLGPHREALLPYQRAAHDFFISDSLREELQRKSDATLQTLPNSTLPPQIDHFHSLVPLDTTNQKNAALFGYPSWIYKAVSSKDGNTYALRRLEGYRLTNEKAIRSVQNWKRIVNGNIVTVIDAFTKRSFGDSSLMIVTDYHPLAKTLSDTHFSASSRYSNRNAVSHVTELVLWSYIVQISNALKTIHGAGLAARIIEPSKILLTSKNRIRLNACAVLDVVQYDAPRSIQDLQRDDLLQFGRLLLSLAMNNPSAIHNLPKSLEQLSRSYSPQIKDRVLWLLSMTTPNKTEGIDHFLLGLEPHVMSAFNSTQHLNDQLNSELNRELENSRIARLMMKLNFITERPDYSHDRQWAETGERFPIKLFRDYVFHQVDAQGNPVLDMGHVLACLNKLDAGVEEKMVLTSRDDQIVIIPTYKEMKRAIEGAYGDLVKAARRGGPM